MPSDNTKLQEFMMLEQQEIDRQFEAMADDDEYQTLNTEISKAFAESDWDALKDGENEVSSTVH